MATASEPPAGEYEDAMKALEAIENEGVTTDDQIDALRSIVQHFKPYDGDDLERAKSRQVINCRCRNCDFVSAAFSAPSALTDCAKAAARRAICPRCYSTHMLMTPS